MRLIRPVTITDNGGSFSRATTGTYIDKNGVLQTAAINAPRYDYSGGVFKGLLLEASATNSVINSEDFSAWTEWIDIDVDITANATTAPDGTNTADKLSEATTSISFHGVYQNSGVDLSNTTITCSAYVKPAERNILALIFYNATHNEDCIYVYFDLNSGTVTSTSVTGTATLVSTQITELQNGYFRCSATGIYSTQAGNILMMWNLVNSGTTREYAGTAGSGLYLWGAQIEVGSAATSYIPTGAAPVTRAADVMTATLLCDVPENDYTEFAMGTTYATGDTVLVATGVELLTLDVAPATPWAVGDLITGQTSAKTARVVLKLTDLTYQIRERSGAFTLGEIIGVTGTPAKLADQGAAHPTVTATTDRVHQIYESLQNGNLAKYPPTNTTGVTPYWLQVSYDNRWKMLDNVSASQTTQAESFTYTIQPGIIDSISFLGAEGTTIDVAINDPTEGLVYSEQINLITTSTVNDDYTYFFEPIVTVSSAVLLGIPPYGSAYITVTVNNPGGIAKLGDLTVGLQYDLGDTQQGPSKGMTSYSTKGVNSFGEAILVPGANAKNIKATSMFPNTLYDAVDQMLTSLDAVLVVWIGTDANYAAFITKGYYVEWSLSMPYPLDSLLNIEIEGVI